jgi:hypothetical protein
MNTNELDVTRMLTGPGGSTGMFLDRLRDAIDLASDQDRMTWLTSGGKRVAAIVPVDVAERGDF